MKQGKHKGQKGKFGPFSQRFSGSSLEQMVSFMATLPSRKAGVGLPDKIQDVQLNLNFRKTNNFLYKCVCPMLGILFLVAGLRGVGSESGKSNLWKCVFF